MVGAHHVVPEDLAEQVGDALGHPACVGEHERRAVGGDQLADAADHLEQLLGGHHRLELAAGQLDRDVEAPAVTDVDDGATWRSVLAAAPRSRPDEEAGDGVDRALRGGEADARRAAARHEILGHRRLAVGAGRLGREHAAVEALEAERKVRATLVAGQGVDLVDDHRLDRAQHRPAPRGGEQQVERLGSRDDDLGAVTHHRGACRLGRVAVAHGDTQRRNLEAELGGDGGDLLQRRLEVLPDVDGERPQRGDVEDCGSRPVALEDRAEAAVDRDEEAGEGLARARRCGDERVLAGGDRGPAECLGGRRAPGEAPPEPLGDRRVEAVQRGNRFVGAVAALHLCIVGRRLPSSTNARSTGAYREARQGRGRWRRCCGALDHHRVEDHQARGSRRCQPDPPGGAATPRSGACVPVRLDSTVSTAPATSATISGLAASGGGGIHPAPGGEKAGTSAAAGAS